ncbi:MAG: hypothetical protein AB1585_12080 [Thermodesulfobacteriota bacterium]
MCTNGGKTNPNPNAFIENLRRDMPLGRKIRLFLSNNWIKIKNRQNCCGHPGEPGC